MSRQIRIPCVMMRGGTSRGPFFRAADLPGDPALRDPLLLSAMGAGQEMGIDGMGGASPLTCKVAIVGPATVPWADVDYLFAQVRLQEQRVDTSANCGNMLAGVGPFAIESGLVAVAGETTRVRIHNVNTGKLIEATVATPDGCVTYDGDTAIDGVPGTAAPVELAFIGAAGARTGRLLPTGAAAERIDGIEVTCLDAAMPVMLVRAADLGRTGHESPAAFGDAAFRERLEAMRIEAGRRMGLGDVRALVVPKPVLIAPAVDATLAVRYFMPHACHSALAVTGAVAIATACLTPGTVAASLTGPLAAPAEITLAHPAGRLALRMAPGPEARLVRTARRLFEGAVFARAPAAPPCKAQAAPPCNLDAAARHGTGDVPLRRAA
ncbi:MAG: 4-oxalomesaconate tautomerase [Rhodospirillales bacterium]|nr:4-oxalomesaconate tautomerase [Rhodospirillales bacterium]